MATVELNGAAITDAESFHVESQRAFGFPDSYAHTMDSWVDCLSYLRDEDGMSSVRLKKDEVLHIVVTHSEALRERAPDGPTARDRSRAVVVSGGAATSRLRFIWARGRRAASSRPSGRACRTSPCSFPARNAPAWWSNARRRTAAASRRC